MRRPRRPIKLTKAETSVVVIALANLVTETRITNRFSEEEYQSWLDLIAHLQAGRPLYKLGHSPIPPATDPNS